MSEWWANLSAEEKSQFIRDSIERSHKKQYEDALALFGFDGPAWEDLSEEKREAIREENRQYARDMNEFGKAIANGTEKKISSFPRR